ncbi:GIY-YIG nuclease family protein [Oceanimonas marisflavi]|uniref:GIY-YIG nuclease family protein n=1 Tax=Oceanimonas marisflavi TaxID=2059724 RepID=UPI0013006E4E|nr:GIY-YIG nuclease family protein [Oceanimonas marisflavi]
MNKFESISSMLNHFSALPYEDREQLPSNSGIYIVTRLKEEILYIGRTNNFYTRWLSHHKADDIESMYNKSEVLIIYCSMPETDIYLTEAKLINIFRPPLNEILFLENETMQLSEWLSSEVIDTADMPRELRLWVHKKCHCSCAVCGSIVGHKGIGITTYTSSKITSENLAMVCRKCKSKMRHTKNLEEFKNYRKELILNQLEKIKDEIIFYYDSETFELEELKKSLVESSLTLAFEKTNKAFKRN